MATKQKLPDDCNYQFFKNELRSAPDKKLIDEIFKDWYYDYVSLERHHGFIQWIFPELNRKGSNPFAKELFKVDRRLKFILRSKPSL